ncbi:MAG: aminotransferase class I/II-fold pyridoxal phosphate-dependent enzyme [Egibacteraceae bacterium]
MSVLYQISAQSASGIVASVEDGVTRGQLAPGAVLPPVRALAASLGISPATVAAAYQRLRSRGVVVSAPRRGVRVAPRPPLSIRAAEPVPAGVRDLASGNPDPRLLPRLLTHHDQQAVTPRLYGEPSMLPALADLARAQLETDGIRATHVAVTSGAMDGIERVLGAHLRPGDCVAVEDPGYTGVLDLLRAMGLEPAGIRLDERGPLPDRLAAVLSGGACALILTPRAQNPTGAALDAERAGEVAAVLETHPDVLVIEDDHAGPVAGAAYRTTTTGRRRWAVVRSVSKSLGPDLRVAVLAGDPITLRRVEGRQRLGPGWVSGVLQQLVADLWADGAVTAQLTEAASAYAARRAALIAALAAHDLRAAGASGLNVWVAVPEEGAVSSGLLRAGWAVQPGEPYRLASPPAVRITTAALTEPEAVRVAADLAALFTPAARTRRA